MDCTLCLLLAERVRIGTICIIMQHVQYTMSNEELRPCEDVILLVVYKVLFLRDTWSKTTSTALAVTSCVNSECCSGCVGVCVGVGVSACALLEKKRLEAGAFSHVETWMRILCEYSKKPVTACLIIFGCSRSFHSLVVPSGACYSGVQRHAAIWGWCLPRPC